jgi:hypothetical protein
MYQDNRAAEAKDEGSQNWQNPEIRCSERGYQGHTNSDDQP